MGLISKLFGGDGVPDRYRTEAEYKANRARRAEESRALAGKLDGGARELHFVFRTGKKGRAKELVRALGLRGLTAEVKAEPEGEFSIEGAFELRSTSSCQVVSDRKRAAAIITRKITIRVGMILRSSGSAASSFR